MHAYAVWHGSLIRPHEETLIVSRLALRETSVCANV